MIMLLPKTMMIMKVKSGYSDDVLTALLDKLQKAGDAKGLYDFGCILEKEDIGLGA